MIMLPLAWLSFLWRSGMQRARKIKLLKCQRAWHFDTRVHLCISIKYLYVLRFCAFDFVFHCSQGRDEEEEEKVEEEEDDEVGGVRERWRLDKQHKTNYLNKPRRFSSCALSQKLAKIG